MTRTEQEHMVERYLRGNMGAMEEERFFIEVALNGDLRRTLRAHRLVDSAMRKHRESAVIDRVESYSRFMTALGSGASVEGGASGSLAQILRVFIGEHVGSVSAVIAFCLLMAGALLYGEPDPISVTVGSPNRTASATEGGRARSGSVQRNSRSADVGEAESPTTGSFPADRTERIASGRRDASTDIAQPATAETPRNGGPFADAKPAGAERRFEASGHDLAADTLNADASGPSDPLAATAPSDTASGLSDMDLASTTDTTGLADEKTPVTVQDTITFRVEFKANERKH